MDCWRAINFQFSTSRTQTAEEAEFVQGKTNSRSVV